MMRMPFADSKLFVAGAALLVGAVAIASFPSPALAGDDAFFCPGTRCSGRQLPICCDVVYPMPGGFEADLYYFPNAT